MAANMAKKASKSTKSRSPSASTGSAESTKRVSNEKLVVRIKSGEALRRSTRLSVISGEKEITAKSAMKRSPKVKKKIQKFDAKKPKKPPTAFFYFLEDFRKEFQEQNPDVKSMRDIGKACGEKWKTMEYEGKVKYYDIATEKRAEFDRAMTEYIKREERGENEDTEDDSEFDE